MSIHHIAGNRRILTTPNGVKFVLGDKIGEGSFGIVFSAHNKEGAVALKMTTSNVPRDFRSNESKMSAGIKSQYVAGAIESFACQTDGGYKGVDLLPLYQMDLFDYVMAHGRLEGEQALAFVKMLLEALDAVHKAEITHYDLKADNILVNIDGQGRITNVAIADFGLASQAPPECANCKFGCCENQSCPGIAFPGSLQYIAPELLDRDVSCMQDDLCNPHPIEKLQKPDLYSMGVVLYVALCREFPFPEGASKFSVDYGLYINSLKTPNDLKGIGKQPKNLLERYVWTLMHHVPEERPLPGELLKEFERLGPEKLLEAFTSTQLTVA